MSDLALTAQIQALEAELHRLEGQAVLSWSAGKDSTALLAVAAEVWRSGIVVLGSHGPDGYPGTPELVEAWRERAPHLTFEVLDWSCHLQDLRDGGGRRDTEMVRRREQRDRHKMRDLLARHGIGRQILAIRAEESGSRAKQAKTHRKRRYEYVAGRDWGSPRVHVPMLDWTVEDVINVIRAFEAPVHPLYRLAGWDARSHPCLFMPRGGLNQRVPWAQDGPVHFPDWWRERCEVTPNLASWTEPPPLLEDLVGRGRMTTHVEGITHA